MAQTAKVMYQTASPAAEVISHDQRARRADMSDALLAVMRRHGLEIKEVAFWLGIDPAHLSRILANAPGKYLNDDHLDALDKSKPTLLDEVAAEFAHQRNLLTGSKAHAARILESVHAVMLGDDRNTQLPARAGAPIKMGIER